MSNQIRSARLDDLEAIKALAVATELFALEEVAIFDEMLAASVDGRKPDDAFLVVEDAASNVGGAAYYAPEPFSDRLWNLYFLAVDPDLQGTGAGQKLVGAVEQDLQAKGADRARILLVETSGLPRFEPTRQFYLHLGFDEEARIRQFYGPDDDKVVYWKAIGSR